MSDERVIDLDESHGSIHTLPGLENRQKGKPTIRITKRTTIGGKVENIAPKDTRKEPKPTSKTEKTEKKKPVSKQTKAELKDTLAGVLDERDELLERVEKLEQGMGEPKQAPEPEQDDTPVLVRYNVPKFGDMTVPVDFVYKTSNDAVLVLGNRLSTDRMQIVPSAIDSGDPANVDMVIGPDCSNPVQLAGMVNLGRFICEPLNAELHVFLSMPVLTLALRGENK